MRVLTPVWLTFVAAISLMPLRLKYRVGTTGFWHNPGHFLIFFITSVLVCRTAATSGSRFRRLAGICCFAVVTEILETVAYHNAMEWRDVLLDFLGAALGLVAIGIVRSGPVPIPTNEIRAGDISGSRGNL